MNDRSGLLSICRKAGKLKMGMDIVKGGCESGEVKAVFVTSDISEKSLKEIRYCCAVNEVKVFRLEMTMDMTASALGRRSGILGVCDSGFAKALAKSAERISADLEDFYS